MQRRRSTPSPAFVVSLIALVVALGGTTYAAKISHSTLGAAAVVGAGGAPPFENSWQPAGPQDEGVSFYKDPWGIVHLQGNTFNSESVKGTIFTLPLGYRPAANLYFAAYGALGTAAYIRVKADGTVNVAVAQNYIGLSNITFRAAP